MTCLKCLENVKLEPQSTWPRNILGNVKPKLLKTRGRGLTCLNPECSRKFATVKERNCHMHIVHTVLNNNAITCAIVGKDGSLDTLYNVTKPLRRPQHRPQRLQHPQQKIKLGCQQEQKHLNSGAPFLQRYWQREKE